MIATTTFSLGEPRRASSGERAATKPSPVAETVLRNLRRFIAPSLGWSGNRPRPRGPEARSSLGRHGAPLGDEEEERRSDHGTEGDSVPAAAVNRAGCNAGTRR